MIRSIILFLLLNSFYLSGIEISKNHAVILQDSIVYSEPDFTAKVTGSVKRSEIFQIKSISKKEYLKNDSYYPYNFYLIEKGGKEKGWIFGEYLGINIKYYEDDKKYKNVIEFSDIKDNIILSINGDEIFWFATGIKNNFNGFYQIIGVISTEKTNIIFGDDFNKSFYLGLPPYSSVKNITFKDINFDGNKEFIIEYTFHAKTDPTYGSCLSIIKFTDYNYEQVFRTNTFFLSHSREISLSSFLIKNNEILETNIYSINGEQPDKKLIKYLWDDNSKKYIEKEKIKMSIKCKPDISNLRLREKGNLNSKIIMILDPKINYDLINLPWADDENIIINNVYGQWCNIFNKEKNINGWVFSYYLDFEDDFLNIYLKGINKTPGKRASENIYVKFE